jgi:hypothetical protein
VPTSPGPSQAATASRSSAGTTTLTFGANVPAGDVVVAFIWYTGSAPVFSGLGATWSQLVAQVSVPGTAAFLSVYVARQVAGGSAAVTVTGPTATDVIAMDWPGIDNSLTLDVFTTQGGNGVATYNWPGITPVFANDSVAIAFAAGYGSGTPAMSGLGTGGFTATSTRVQTGTPVGAVVLGAGYVADAPGGTKQQTSQLSVTGTTSPAGWAFIAVALRGAPYPAQLGSGSNQAVFGGSAHGTSVKIGAMPITCRIYSADYPIEGLLAVMNRARKLRWDDAYNATGAGSFEVSTSDAKATVANLAVGNIVRCGFGPFDDFDWIIEQLNYTLSSPDGPSGETIVVQGRGLEAYVERGVVYSAVTWSGSAGGLVRTLLAAMQDRGALPLVGTDFTDTTDSSGAPWRPGAAMAINRGQTLLDVIGALRAQGYVFEFRGDFVLRAWNDGSGAHRESSVVFREGRHFSDRIAWAQPRSAVVTHLVVEGAGGITAEVADPEWAGSPTRTEGYYSVATVTNVAGLADAGLAEIARRKLAASAINVGVFHGLDPGQLEPYRHFRKGDWVAAHVPGYIENASELVAAISVEATDAGGYAVRLDFNGRQPDPLLVLDRKARGLIP